MATRLYFPAVTAAAVSPAFDTGGWGYTSEALRRKLANTKGSSAITIGSQIGPWTAGVSQYALDRQYVSTRMDAGVVWKGVAPLTTVSMQLMCREYALSDNVSNLSTVIKVFSEDGLTERWLWKQCSYGAGNEMINNVTHQNKGGNHVGGQQNGSAVDYTTVLGDRLVVEIGYTDTAGTTPEASAKWGENATDLPVNETQTTDGAGWIEFSNTITFAGEIAFFAKKNPNTKQAPKRASSW